LHSALVMGNEYKRIFVNGRFRKPATTEVLSIRNDDGDVIAIVPNCNSQDVNNAFTAANDALDSW
jgi:acyl-CoA reductase-like NAD-dependent aldehyde dehydrogenase